MYRYLMGMLLSMAVLAGCGGVQESVVERAIVARAPQYIGPAEQYDATVQGIGHNQVDLVRLVGNQVNPKSGPNIERLLVTLHGVDYQRNPIKVTAVREADFSARLTDNAINQYLAQDGRTSNDRLHDVRVRFLQEGVEVAGLVSVLGQDIPFTTQGTLEPRGAQIFYHPQTLTVAGVGVPASLQQTIANLVNPVVDLSGLRFTPNIRAVNVQSGTVMLTGNADVASLINAK